MKLTKSDILTIASIAGVAATTVVTAYMAPKADRAIKAKICKEPIIEPNNAQPGSYIITDYKLADRIELVKAEAPYYIPTTLLFTLTVGLIILNHKECKKELLAMSAAATYLAANRDKLRKIVDKPEIRELAKKFSPGGEIDKSLWKHQTIEQTGKGDLLILEGYSGRIFRSSVEAVEEAEEKLKRQFEDDKYCCLNDFYYYLGIEQTQFGDTFGWVNDPDYYPLPIDFTNTYIKADELADGSWFNEDCLTIDVEQNSFPMECWMEV